jgi:hypothetical protein
VFLSQALRIATPLDGNVVPNDLMVPGCSTAAGTWRLDVVDIVFAHRMQMLAPGGSSSPYCVPKEVVNRGRKCC